MKKTLSCLLLLLCHWLFAAGASAEVYKWTDKDGKVHYGDKKANKAAEDITADVKITNIDTSGDEHQKLETIFRKENAADRAHAAEQAKPNPAQVEHAKNCEQARKDLITLEGRVVFIDDKGNAVRTSEDERKKRAEEMRKLIAANCAG